MGSHLTIAQARNEVLRRLGAGDDGANSPDFLAQVEAHIGSVQRLLAIEHSPLMPKLSKQLTVAAGRQWYPLPCLSEGLVGVMLALAGMSEFRLSLGLTLEDSLAVHNGVPAKFDVRSTVGVQSVAASGGTGYTNGAAVAFQAPGGSGTPAQGKLIASEGGVLLGVVITDPGSEYLVPPTITVPGGTGGVATATIGLVDAIFMAPPPSVAGYLHVSYRDIPGSSVAISDSLRFDAEAVIAVVAAEMAQSSQHQLAQVLVAHAGKIMDLLKRRSPMRPAGVGNGFSLGGGK